MNFFRKYFLSTFIMVWSFIWWMEINQKHTATALLKITENFKWFQTMLVSSLCEIRVLFISDIVAFWWTHLRNGLVFNRQQVPEHLWSFPTIVNAEFINNFIQKSASDIWAVIMCRGKWIGYLIIKFQFLSVCFFLPLLYVELMFLWWKSQKSSAAPQTEHLEQRQQLQRCCLSSAPWPATQVSQEMRTEAPPALTWASWDMSMSVSTSVPCSGGART